MQHEYLYKAELIRVVDGDTLDVTLDLGFGIHYGGGDAVRLRLADIDTPELRSKDEAEKTAALAAKEFVIDTLFCAAYDVKGTTEMFGWPLLVRTIKTRKGTPRRTFGRYVAEVFFQPEGLAWQNLNELLVKEGHAVESKG